MKGNGADNKSGVCRVARRYTSTHRLSLVISCSCSGTPPRPRSRSFFFPLSRLNSDTRFCLTVTGKSKLVEVFSGHVRQWGKASSTGGWGRTPGLAGCVVSALACGVEPGCAGDGEKLFLLISQHSCIPSACCPFVTATLGHLPAPPAPSPSSDQHHLGPPA